MNPNPNYILPREVCDFKQTFELIEELTTLYVNDSFRKGPGISLEIEAKIGYSLHGQNPQQDFFLPILHSLSERDFLLMGMRSHFQNFQHQNQVYNVQKDRLSKKRFLEIKNFLNHQVLDVPDKIKEGESNLSVDFQMHDGSRISYFPKDDKWERIKKIEKSNIDVLHRGNVYRLSYAFEEKLEFNSKNLNTDEIKGIRIKDRKNYEFQYMEYSFTEAVDLNENENDDINIAFLLIKNQFLDKEDKLEFIMDLFISLKLKLLEENEIEVEIKDLRPFFDTRGKPEFGSFLKRFIRNVECLFLIPKYFNSMLGFEFFGTDKKLTPVIGQYSGDLFLEKFKKSKQKKTEKKTAKKDSKAPVVEEKPIEKPPLEKKNSTSGELTLEKSKSEDISNLFE